MPRCLPRPLLILLALLTVAGRTIAAEPSLPSPWVEAPAVGGWSAEGTGDGLTLKSSTRVEGASAVLLPFPVTAGPVEVSFTALAPASSGHRGLNFGLGWRLPQQDAYKASLLTFGGAGQVIFWDSGGFFNVAPYRQGQPTQVRITLDPTLGGFTVALDGKAAPGLFPFYSGIPRVDTLFFTNLSTRAEASPIEIRDIKVAASPAPFSPRGVVVRPRSSTEAEVGWGRTPNAVAYRIYRKGERVAELDASRRWWRESGLPEGRPVAYSVSAVDGSGRESLPSWPVDALLPVSMPRRVSSRRFDLVVTGGTPAGISAALAAARRGARVLLAVPGEQLGGMMAGGLGRTDYRYKGAQRGIFHEFTQRVLAYYNDAYGPDSRTAAEANDGYQFEAKVAEAVFRRMLEQEPRITVRFHQTPVAAEKIHTRLKAVTFTSPGGSRERVAARAFIDASYEGDLLPLADVAYRVGRESRADHDEEHAGVIYWDVDRMDFLPGSTGEGNRLVQAYNYRLPLTNRAGHRNYALKPPPGYRREEYASIAQDVAEGRITSISRVMHYRRIPGEEFDVNNHRYSPSTDYVGHSNDYPDATPERRAEIALEHRRYIEGLLYFLQNDPALPADFRFEANQWGFAQDEFRDNGRFPDQLYIREARRMVGAYTFSEKDARKAAGSDRTPPFLDSVAVGDYMMDSHATRPQEPDRPMGVLEGFFFIPALTLPYQIPYRILVPQTVDGLLTPVAVSATHVGYGTLRMEPVMMAMGEAAGVATQLAGRHQALRDVSPWELSGELVKNGAVLTYFSDLAPDRPEWEAYQRLGTLGLFTDYKAAPDAPVTREAARDWLNRLAAALNAHRLAHGKFLSLEPASAPWRAMEESELSKPFDRDEAVDWLSALTGKRRGMSGAKAALGPVDGPLTRGAFVRALYQTVVEATR